MEPHFNTPARRGQSATQWCRGLAIGFAQPLVEKIEADYQSRMQLGNANENWPDVAKMDELWEYLRRGFRAAVGMDKH
jgi:hypothetical protein